MSTKGKIVVALCVAEGVALLALAANYYSVKGKVVEYMKNNTAAVSIPTSSLPKSWVTIAN